MRYLGTWRRAKEALDLSADHTIRSIEARFRHRRMNKIWRYTDETLGETLARCADYYSCPPTIQQFDWWQQRELELAVAQGDNAIQIPAHAPTGSGDASPVHREVQRVHAPS